MSRAVIVAIESSNPLNVVKRLQNYLGSIYIDGKEIFDRLNHFGSE
jgi:hypothetical protein